MAISELTFFVVFECAFNNVFLSCWEFIMVFSLSKYTHHYRICSQFPTMNCSWEGWRLMMDWIGRRDDNDAGSRKSVVHSFFYIYYPYIYYFALLNNGLLFGRSKKCVISSHHYIADSKIWICHVTGETSLVTVGSCVFFLFLKHKIRDTSYS